MAEKSWLRNWSVVCVTVLHLTWGIMLLFSDVPLGTTPVGNMRVFGPHWAGGAMYVAACAMALNQRTDFWGLLLVMPQQFLLVLSAVTACYCIATSAYFDGVPRPVLFIAADQIVYVFLAVCYTGAILDRFLFSRKA